MHINVSRKAVAEASKKLSNRGRWGGDDRIGTLNHVLPEDIARAAALISRSVSLVKGQCKLMT